MVRWIKRTTSILSVIILVTAFSAMAAGEEWTVPITYQSGNTTIDLAFGTNVSATDGFDSNIDEPAPPLPPGATKYAYFQIEDPLVDNRLSKDYRPPIDQSNPTETWTLVVTSDEPINLTWDAFNVPSSITLGMDINNDGHSDLDMKTSNTLQLSSGVHTLYIYASVQQQREVIPVPVETSNLIFKINHGR